MLLVHPQVIIRHMVGGYLRQLGCAVDETADPREALDDSLGAHDLVVLASELTHIDSGAVMQLLKQRQPARAVTLLCSGAHEQQHHDQTAGNEPANGGSDLSSPTLGAPDLTIRLPAGIHQLADQLRALRDNRQNESLVVIDSAADSIISADALAHLQRLPDPRFHSTFEAFVGAIPEWIAELDSTIADGLTNSARHACLELERCADSVGARHLSRLAATFRMLSDADEMHDPLGYIEELEQEYTRAFRILLKVRGHFSNNARSAS